MQLLANEHIEIVVLPPIWFVAYILFALLPLIIAAMKGRWGWATGFFIFMTFAPLLPEISKLLTAKGLTSGNIIENLFGTGFALLFLIVGGLSWLICLVIAISLRNLRRDRRAEELDLLLRRMTRIGRKSRSRPQIMGVACGRCGFINQPNVSFCGGCGLAFQVNYVTPESPQNPIVQPMRQALRPVQPRKPAQNISIQPSPSQQVESIPQPQKPSIFKRLWSVMNTDPDETTK